jgi:predicted permease
MSTDRPVRAIAWLLSRVSSTCAAQAAIGDILEELAERRSAGRPPRWAALWLNLRILAAAGAAARAAAPRVARSAGHVVRDATRALRRSPGHAVFIFLVLAMAIAAATVTFSVVDAVVFKPLPFDHPDRLVLIGGRDLRGPTPLRTEQFWPVHDGVPAFEHMAALLRSTDRVPVTVDRVTEQMTVMRSTAELFDVLRLAPAAGRIWSREEESRRDHVAVIAYRFWQRRWSGDPGVLGRVLQVDKDTYRIVGVLPASADAAQTIGWSHEVWLPYVPDRVVTDRSSTFASAIGRLREGATPALAQAQMTRAVGQVDAAKPAAYAGWQPEVTRWEDALVARVSGWMLLALGAVALVVLIGCVNAANVMLARSLGRARELAVRASLGASRRQLAASLLTESLLLSLAATAAALLFAAWGVGAAKTALPAGIFRADAIALNGRVLAVSILAAVATGLLFGTVPAWLASRVSIVTLLKDAGATATSARRGWRSGLLVAQIACISVLLVASALFVGSFIGAMRIDLGVDRSALLAVSPRMAFKVPVDDVQTRLRQVRGVADVAVVTYTSLPLVAPAFGGAYGDVNVQPVGGGGAPVAVLVYRVTPNYFDVTGMRFTRGSVWSTSPAADPLPAVLDERAAQRLFGARDPLGQQLSSDFPDDQNYYKERKAIFTVVGVVPYVYSRGPEEDAKPAVYLPIVPRPSRVYASLFARTTTPAITLVPSVEHALAPVAGAGETSLVHAADEAFYRLTATRRFTAALMTLFALFAMAIGAAGIYGVMASIVAQRTREIGVRIALGATGGDISRGVVGQVARYLVAGLAAGLPVAWWCARGFGALFFQVGPTDVSVYLTVAVLLGLVALAAAVAPARRAARVDPVVSLRAS